MSPRPPAHVLAAAVASLGAACTLFGLAGSPAAAANPTVAAGQSITVSYTCDANAMGMMVDVMGPDGAYDMVLTSQSGAAQDVTWNVPLSWPGGQTTLAGTCTYDGPMPAPVNRFVDVTAAPPTTEESTTSTTEETTTSTTEAPVEETTTSTTEAPTTTAVVELPTTTAAPTTSSPSTSTTAPATSTTSPSTTTAPASAATVPPVPPASDGSLDVSDTAWSPTGDTITLTATGYAPGSTVRFFVYSTPRELGTAVADATGSANLVVPIPDDMERGAHTVVSYGIDETGRDRVLSQSVTFATQPAAPASAADPAALPRTGSTSGGLVVLGLALVLAGVALRVVAGRSATATA
jgi:hypothetical protein